MKSRDVVIGLIVLVVLISAALLVKKGLMKKSVVVTPLQQVSIQQKIETSFGGIQIPSGVERTDLVDVSGGEGIGIATRTEVLANLPDLEPGKFYEVWLEKDGKSVLLGKMRVAKGGWILEYNSANYPGYNKVIVTVGDKHILEGSF